MRSNETIFEEGAKISQEASSPLTPDLSGIVSSFGVDSPRGRECVHVNPLKAPSTFHEKKEKIR